jgi:hypothetical protein
MSQAHKIVKLIIQEIAAAQAFPASTVPQHEAVLP